MKQCPHCGALMSDTDTFCPSCGKSPLHDDIPPEIPTRTPEDEEVERLLREFRQEEERRNQEIAARRRHASAGENASSFEEEPTKVITRPEPRPQAAQPHRQPPVHHEQPRRPARETARPYDKKAFALFPKQKPASAARQKAAPATKNHKAFDIAEEEPFSPRKTPRALPWLVFGLICAALAIWGFTRMFSSMNDTPAKTEDTQKEQSASSGESGSGSALPAVAAPYAADYLGKTVEEVQKLLGQGAIMPDEGWNGSRYFYYESSPFAFYFNPEKWDKVTGKEQVVSIDVSKGGSVREKLASNFTLSQIKKAAGTEVQLHVPSSPQDTQEWFVELTYDAYTVVFTWDQSDMEQPAQFATIRLKSE